MPLSPQERDNLTRWDETKKGFYEVYYLKWNDLPGETAGWIRYTLQAPLSGEPQASVWAIFSDGKDPKKSVALKRDFSLTECRIEQDCFYFAAGPSAIFDGGARGEIFNAQNRISWELKFSGPLLSLRHYPPPLYWGGFPKTKLLAPYLSTRLTGEFTVNDRRLRLEGVPAHQAHLWGTEMATSWVWGNANTFAEDPNFCFEGLTAQVAVAGRPSPPLTLLFFSWKGKLYRFNGPTDWIANKSHATLDRWHFEAGTRKVRFVGDLFADPEQMVAVRYENPRGGERFCHNTKLADLKIQILEKEKSGWGTVKVLTARRSAAFEVVGPTLDPHVRLMIP